MLNERKFMTILRQVLEEAEKAACDGVGARNTSDSGEDKPAKVSKKRKRSGELVVASSDSWKGLPAALFAAMHQIAHFTKVRSEVSEGGRTAAFSTDYMKATIRTTAEDAAKILGKWLSLCRESSAREQTLDPAQTKLWLSPFIEIWESRTVGSGDLMQFSLYCSQPVLSLLKEIKAGHAIADWKDELERLVARNIMIPAKAAKLDNADSDLLNTLTRVSVIQDSANAPLLLEVAIRSIQAQGSRRRRLNDESWLQIVFAMLKEAMPSQRVQANAKAVGEMLQNAIRYKVDLELSPLRSVTSQYGFLEGSTNWELLATIIKLDANTFLVPNANENDFLQELLTRITVACIEPTWADISAQVVSSVLIPLMNAFAKARDLSAFIRHWFAQLVEFEKRRKEARLFSMALFGAWEDETLQIEFSKVMEASLTVSQITQLLDWLSKQIAESPDSVCVILEAMAGSITQEEIVDAVGLRLFHIMFHDSNPEKLDGRYKWRSWRILSRSLKWITPTNLEEISSLWEKNAGPFESLAKRFGKGSLLEVVNGSSVELETLEVLRCTCAAWDASKEGSRLERLARKSVLDIFQSLAQDSKLLLRDLFGEQELGEEQCGSTLNTLYRGIGWTLWSYIHCVFVEHPRMLG
jgi:nucleolar pre-ribosomal-associated protein 2